MAANLALVKNETIDAVEQRIRGFQKDGALHFPADYSPQNALKSAWLVLQETVDRNGKPVLEACTRESIANALLSTVVQGLSPLKKQVYYIAYGNKLTAMRSYHGTMAVTQRIPGVEDVVAQVVYEGDEFEYAIQRGTKKVVKHVQKIQNVNTSKIAAAYCSIYYADGKEYTEVMTMSQIKMAWSKSQMKDSKPQREFPEEMAKRTVINRACKKFINASCDNDLVLNAFNDTAEAVPEDEFKREVEAKANKRVITGDGEVIEVVGGHNGTGSPAQYGEAASSGAQAAYHPENAVACQDEDAEPGIQPTWEQKAAVAEGAPF
jgi:recombination protein RecT